MLAEHSQLHLPMTEAEAEQRARGRETQEETQRQRNIETGGERKIGLERE